MKCLMEKFENVAEIRETRNPERKNASLFVRDYIAVDTVSI